MAKQPVEASKLPVLSVMLFLLAVCAFLPSLNNDFTNFDDPLYVTKNIHVNQGLTWAGLGWAFHSTDGGIWLPLTWISHMLDCQIYGLKPWGHHLTSVLIHAFNSVLLFLAFRRMTGAVWRSFFVAALFALHPLRVESVAWVAERKDVLSALFWMLALLAYARYAQRRSALNPQPSTLNYFLALLAFICGLMAKPMLVTLPFVLLLLDYWPLGRFRDGKNFRRLALEKWPFFAVSLLAGIVTFAVQRHEKAVVVLAQLPPLARIENAIVSCVRYLGKTFWPDDLCVYYPRPEHWPLVVVLSAAILLAIVSSVFVWQRRQHPYLLVGWLWFLGTLVPVIGLVQVGEQAMADRYTYLPQIGLLMCLVWGVAALAQKWKWHEVIPSTLAAAAIIVCLLLTWRQIGWWKDSEILFRHAIAVTGKNAIAHINLGVALDDAGRSGEAVEEFRTALRDTPNSALACNGLGLGLFHLGRMEEAAAALQAALAIKPDYATACLNLGNVFFDAGRMKEAFTNYLKAVEFNPDLADAYYGLGNVFFKSGQVNDAISFYEKALSLHPGLAEAQDNLGNVLLQSGKADEAIGHYQKALEINPANVNARNNLGTALMRAGRLQEAIDQYRKALEIRPDSLNACGNLGLALFKTGRIQEAIATAQHALQLAGAQTNAAQMDILQKQLNLYQTGSPSH